MIAIRDFDMPKDCDSCPFYTYHNDAEDDCRITGEGLYHIKEGEKHPKCPLVAQPCEDAVNRTDMLDAIGHGTTYTSEDLQRIVKGLPPVGPQMVEQWKELKETIIEMRDNDGTGTQQEVCKFLANLMDVLEKQMQEPKTGQ